MHRQGQSAQALRVRRQGLGRNDASPCQGWPIRNPCRIAAGQSAQHWHARPTARTSRLSSSVDVAFDHATDAHCRGIRYDETKIAPRSVRMALGCTGWSIVCMVTLQDEWSSNLILPIGRSPSTPHGIYDGHTLAKVIPDMEALVGNTILRLFADKGYRGHNAPPDYKFRASSQARRHEAPGPP